VVAYSQWEARQSKWDSQDRNSETSKSLAVDSLESGILINDCQQWEFWRRVRVGILEKNQRKSGNSGGDLE